MKLTVKNGLVKHINPINWLCFELTNTDMNKLNKLLENEFLEIDIKKKGEIRSLQANAYCWTIIHKIAQALNSTDEEIYHKMLIDYGTKEYVSTVPVIAKELEKSFKIVIEVKDCTINEEAAKVYKLIRGSSTYTKEEMQKFIDGVVYEAKKLNIETMTPQELKSMMNNWKGV